MHGGYGIPNKYEPLPSQGGTQHAAGPEGPGDGGPQAQHPGSHQGPRAGRGKVQRGS